MKRILIFGSNHSKTAQYHKTLNLSKSVLVDSVSKHYDIGHTSRQEFYSDSDLEICLSTADEVFWAFPDATEFPSIEIFYETVEWLKKYNDKYQNVKNLNQMTFDSYNWNHVLPVLTPNDAVFLGCSFTRGIGLSDPNTHYAQIVSKYFKKNCVNLAQRGLNNHTSFELLTQLDFHPGQIVVWQITYLERIRYVDSQQRIYDILFTVLSKDLLLKFTEVYSTSFLFYELLSKIRAVVNLMRVKKVKLVFWLVDYKEKTLYSQKDQMYFYEFKEFIPGYKLENYIVDGAEDKLHPGVNSNKIIADVVIEHLEKTYEILK